jgi:anaerobic selenocysteine-containing dehydrogenase
MVGIGAGATSVTEIPKADVIVIAGKSITDSHPVISQYFVETKQNGAKIIVIDPRTTRTDVFADVHIKIKPCTDIFLFNAVGNYFIQNNRVNNDFINARTDNFESYKSMVASYTLELAEEKTGIPKETIKQFADLVSGGKTIFSWGLGLTQLTGTKGIKSYIDLVLLTGNIGKEGTGIVVYRGQTNVQSSGGLIKPDIFPNGPLNHANSTELSKVWEFKPPICKETNIPEAFYGNEGKIKALFLMGYNPVRSLPDKAKIENFLKFLELVIVEDIFMTENTDYAYIVVPAAA